MADTFEVGINGMDFAQEMPSYLFPREDFDDLFRGNVVGGDFDLAGVLSFGGVTHDPESVNLGRHVGIGHALSIAKRVNEDINGFGNGEHTLTLPEYHSRVHPAVDFCEIQVADASKELLAAATRIVNEANAAHVRIFPDERLEPDEIEQDYAAYLLVLATKGDRHLASMTAIEKDGGLKVELLAVAPNVQKAGLGKQMLHRAVEIAAAKGLDRVWLEAVDHGRLVAFYRGHGFVEDFRKRMPVGTWASSEAFDLVTLSYPILS